MKPEAATNRTGSEPRPSAFDAHCHLQDERLAGSLDACLDRARAAGVQGFLCCGSSEEDWEAVARLARAHRDVVPAFGLHPWYVAARSPRWLDRLREYLETHPGAALGEVGLDHALKERNDADQAAAFLAQLRLAAELGRAVSIHCRRAWGALLETLPTLSTLPGGFMVHSFSGSTEMIRPLADAGAYFSFSGSITWSENTRGRSAVCAVPEKRLLIETDAPDLPPAPAPDEPRAPAAPDALNEPANLLRVAETLAELRAVSLTHAARVTRDNACRLYGITA